MRSDPEATGSRPSRAGRLRALGWAVPFVLFVGLLLVITVSPPGPGPSAPAARPKVAPADEPAPPDARPAAGTIPPEPRVPLLSDDEAWGRLPDLVSGKPGPLPAWARALAGTLPRTTAAMLELDALHRTGGGLSPELRGHVRWAAARAGHCAYGEAYALADLRAAGLGEAADRLAAGDPPPAHRDAMAFAEKLTTDPQAVTDADVAGLIDRYGEKPVVAMVLGVAHAHFLDRLALALGLPVEAGGPVPPLTVRFARRPFGIASAPPTRRPAPAAAAATPPDTAAPPTWPASDPEGVRCKLVDQRARRSRIRLPGADPTANRWGLVGQTYQPELSTAWNTCTQAFGEEANQDPVFEQSLFWVVTRTKGCFY